jgi:hypothetical protein
LKNKIAASLTCLLILGVGAWTTHKPAPTQENSPQVVNKTAAFQVVSLELNAARDAYLLTLKNGYGKNINGYSIGAGASKLDVDLTGGERTIAPGDTAKESIPVSNLRAGSNETQPQADVSVLAVMFDDGSHDGDERAIAMVRQRRLGAKLQLQRINAILESAIATSSGVTPDTIDNVRTQISALSVEPPAGQSPMLKSGLKSAKEDLLLEIDRLKQNRGDFQEGLQKIKGKANRRASSL